MDRKTDRDASEPSRFGFIRKASMVLVLGLLVIGGGGFGRRWGP